jgi:hypothetical protein
MQSTKETQMGLLALFFALFWAQKNFALLGRRNGAVQRGKLGS